MLLVLFMATSSRQGDRLPTEQAGQGDVLTGHGSTAHTYIGVSETENFVTFSLVFFNLHGKMQPSILHKTIQVTCKDHSFLVYFENY